MADALTRAWHGVEREGERLRALSLRRLFARDPERFSAHSFTCGDLLVDLSKEKIDRTGLDALLALARAAALPARRDALFAGERVNSTEGQAALHPALRGGAGESVVVDGGDVMPGIEAVRERFLAFAEEVRAGRRRAQDGGPFTDVIHIGIGGSHRGPEMAVRALRPDHDGPRLHFVANLDGSDLADTAASLDPARTLVLVASKSFTTEETMVNARAARGWLEAALGPDAAAHMGAISANVPAAEAFGIGADRTFGFWDWVGGRYSLWSAIGLPIAIAIGADRFRALLAGAAAMDAHFRTAPIHRNLPALLGLLSVWRRNVMGCASVALIPYDQRLERFPAYVQQLVMESNGKRTAEDGGPVARPTAPVVWGEPGTNAQHSFFQHLHQGTDVTPVEFIAGCEPRGGDRGHHERLFANCLAQGQALAFGRPVETVRAEMRAAGADESSVHRLAPHRSSPGDRPSTTILYRRLDPCTLGRLAALYEHRVFVESVLWDVNPFDQFGVALGKELAGTLLPAVEGGPIPAGSDSSTAGLIRHFRRLSAGSGARPPSSVAGRADTRRNG